MSASSSDSRLLAARQAGPRRSRCSAEPRRLTLLTRAYCHLCDEMREALGGVATRFDAVITELDVDADPALERAFGEWVPVLLLGSVTDGVELCHYRLDHERVVAALASEVFFR